jgi:uncharacterized membrane protein YcgQ (UPF0703/DUF1980 family)
VCEDVIVVVGMVITVVMVRLGSWVGWYINRAIEVTLFKFYSVHRVLLVIHRDMVIQMCLYLLASTSQH